MQTNKNIVFLSDDMGAPALDKIREDYKDRFINVGIAEQNLINIAAGLALEGFDVFVYAIAPFYMRAYEQIRINLSLTGELRNLNVNLIGVGAGLSYDVSGPTHHCVEDITIMRALPNLKLFSPCDWITVKNFIKFSIDDKCPKYLRFDGKPLPSIYLEDNIFDWQRGIVELKEGKDCCIISTGYMTHKALNVANKLINEGESIGVIDVFMLKSIDLDYLYNLIKKYKSIITLEEAFINKGGLDSIIMGLLNNKKLNIALKNFGIGDSYVYKYAARDRLHSINNFGESDIIKYINSLIPV